jgi:hypothetical protein
MQRTHVTVLAFGLLLNVSAHGQTAAPPQPVPGPASAQTSTTQSSNASTTTKPSSPQTPGQTPKVQSSARPYYPGRSNSALANSGPSLGEIARQNRDRQAAEEASGVKPKMITNKDVPQDPEGVESSRTAQPTTQRASGNSPYANQSYGNQPSANQAMADQRAGEQWRERIEEQKNRVSSLQARIDQINSQIRARGGTVQYDQPYSRYAAQAQERVAEMQQQLNEQQRRLEMMQEAARRAGMHTSIYDP